MAIIIPSILEESLDGFLSKQNAVLKFPHLERIQVDFSDGEFTPHKTIDVKDLEVLNPLYQWEAHLMLKNPQDAFLDCKIAGFKTVIFHFEAFGSSEEIKNALQNLKSLKISAGLAINPETPVETIQPYLGLADQILVMSVHPGFQGQEFIDETLEKLKKLRNISQNAKIEIDGGIKLPQAETLSKLGADYLVIGSALFETNPIQRFEEFEKAALQIPNNAKT